MQRKRLNRPVEVATKAKAVGKPKKFTPVVDDGFLSKADPTLIEALLAEAQDELDFREGRKSERFDPPEPRPIQTREEWLARSFVNIQRWRHRKMAELSKDPSLVESLYARDPISFMCHWCDIYEPRNAVKGLPTRMPFILFKRQEELLQFYHACVVEEGNGLVEKSRDMGATWCGVGYSIWMWRFIPGSAIGWGSANSDKLDRLGDAGSIFEKIRLCIRGLPKIFLPVKFSDEDLMHKRIVNADNGNSITGDIGDNIGRGGRTRLYFVDEAAYLEHPDAVEGALSENTRVRIDISSVSAPGTVFHRTRQAGVEWAPGKPIEKIRYNVFLMDWRDHPEKNAQWAAKRKESFESRGLAHVYAREIERNYAAAQAGSIIKPEWFDAAMDIHKKLDRVLEFQGGKKVAGLDIGDESGDANALTVSEGSRIIRLKSWRVRDTGITARNAIALCGTLAPIELDYDCIGLGAGIKAEANRLKDNNVMPSNVTLIPWAAGGQVLNPHEKVIIDDPQSPTNFKFYANLKTQGWWHVRQLFYNSFRAVHEGMHFPVQELICIDMDEILSDPESNIALVHKLRDELCQVVTKLSQLMKINIEKAPVGTQSPNLADSLVMAKWPLPTTMPGLITSFYGPEVVRA